MISYQSGNQKALSLLVKRHNKKICVHAYRYTKDWESARDITQDTWRIVIDKIHFLRDTNSFSSWVMTIATRNALDYIKKNKKYFKKVNEQFLERIPNSSNEIVNREEQITIMLNNAIAKLSFNQQMVLKLFYIEEYSLKEISEITKTSLNTVKTRLFRAREKMKEILKKQRDE